MVRTENWELKTGICKLGTSGWKPKQKELKPGNWKEELVAGNWGLEIKTWILKLETANFQGDSIIKTKQPFFSPLKKIDT